MRSQFTFYKSFDDAIEDMTDKQIVLYVKELLAVQFLRKKPEDVRFKDPIVNMAWKSQKHSVEKSIKGYLDSQKCSKVKSPYLGIYDPLVTPSEGGHQQEQVKEEEEGKVKVKGEDQICIVPESESLAHRTIDYLNQIAGKKFGYNKGNLKEIKSQINKGATEDQFAHIINVKCAEWVNDANMKKHLNPVTLFRESNFNRYLNQEMEYTGSQMVEAMFERDGY